MVGHRLFLNDVGVVTNRRRIVIFAYLIWSVLALVTSNVHSSSSSSPPSGSSSQWSFGEFSDLNMDSNQNGGGPARGGGGGGGTVGIPGVTLNDAIAEMKCAMRLLGIMRTMCQLPRPSQPISATLLPVSERASSSSSNDNDDDVDVIGGGGGGQAAELLMASCDAPLQAAVRLCATQPPPPPSLLSPYFSGNSNGQQQHPFYWQFDRFAARGRRQDNVPNEYPPGFFAARGRRNGLDSDGQEQQRRDRKGDTEDEFPTLYVRGFLGSRG